jgi:hypothetical protein
MKTGRESIKRYIQWQNRLIGELKTRNVKSYVFVIGLIKSIDTETAT